MAPLPYNSTAVLTVLYTHSIWGTRECKFRIPNTGDLADHVESIADFLNDGVAPIWADEVSTAGATLQAAGADFSLPYPFPTITGTNGVAVNQDIVPRFIAVNGRGIVSGRETKTGFYFTAVGVGVNYRYSEGELPAVDTLIGNYIVLCASGAVCTIGNDQIVVRPYANAGYNAYWQRKVRAA